MASIAKRGRKRGSRNRGFFFRAGRGWTALDPASKSTAVLRSEAGERLTERSQRAEAAEAFKRWKVERAEQSKATVAGDRSTVAKICNLYLDHCQREQARQTYAKRADFLFDFTTGYPARFRSKSPNKPADKPKPSDRIHPGFGMLACSELKPTHIDNWIAAHPNWDGSRRSAIQALKRAFNFAVSRGEIGRNPIRGYKSGKANARLTYITPAQEHAMYANANPTLATAIKVCIRTGARYGCEFARLTARHVEITDKGMVWRFSAAEAKTRKPRIIYIRDAEIIAIVKDRMERCPSGALFRNESGGAFDQHSLGRGFLRLKIRLAKLGVTLDPQCCMYSCRHTFAKRVLSGYWTGKPTTIEHLAKLMGNSPDVARKYAEWCDAYTEPLWDAV